MKYVTLILGILISGISIYYWAEVNTSPLSQMPIFFRLTYRLFPYLDLVISAAGLWTLYTGIKRLRE